MASIGNIFWQMDRGSKIAVNTVKPTVVQQTTDGVTYAVGGLAAATTWVAEFFSGMKFTPGCLYVNTKATSTLGCVVNTGSTASPTWTALA